MIEEKYKDLFWAKVKKSDGCWEWQAAKCRDGYGLFSIANVRQYKAHRLMLELQGETVPSNMIVMHTCDNPSCVNPDHLRIGTVQENNQDKLTKNRQKGAVGSSNGRSLLSEELIVQIRHDPRHYTAIAAELNVHPETIRMAKTNTTWKHVDATK